MVWGKILNISELHFLNLCNRYIDALCITILQACESGQAVELLGDIGEQLKDMEEAMQNLSQLFNHGFVRCTLQTSHFPYKGVFPDLQGAMPAFLVEMCVFSAPGVVEFLPAMPDSLMEGAIDGVWLYTFAKLEHMTWNRQRVQATLTSNQEQTLTLRCRKAGCCMLVNGRELPMTGDHGTYAFARGETVRVEILM